MNTGNKVRIPVPVVVLAIYQRHRDKLPRLLLALGLLGLLAIGALYAVENWLGYRAIQGYLRETNAPGVNAQGRFTTYVDLAPPPIPDGQNFAMTPVLAPLFQFKPGTQEYSDSNAVERVCGFAHVPFVLKRGWSPTQPTDWGAWQKFLLTTTNASPDI